MKRLIYGILLFSIFQFSCSVGEQSRMTFKNLSASDLTINFRGEVVNVLSKKTVEVKNIPKGRYTYETTFTVPFGAKTWQTSGDVSGEVIVNPGTKVLVLYSSAMVDTAYTLYASLTTSDDLNDGTTTP